MLWKVEREEKEKAGVCWALKDILFDKRQASTALKDTLSPFLHADIFLAMHVWSQGISLAVIRGPHNRETASFL